MGLLVYQEDEMLQQLGWPRCYEEAKCLSQQAACAKQVDLERSQKEVLLT